MPKESHKRFIADEVDIVALALSHQTQKCFDEAAFQIRREAGGPLYESVDGQPGLIRQIGHDGEVVIGTFKNQTFIKAGNV